MRVLQIARKDFTDTIRSRQLYFLIALFAIIGAGVGYVADESVGEILVILMLLLVPLVGLVFTQHSITEKRQTGEMTTLLGLPFSRRIVVVGTYLGRLSLLVTTLFVLYASALVLGLATGTAIELSVVGGGLLLLVVLGAVFVSIALGISAATESSTVASIGSFLVYLVFVFQLWGQIPFVILYGLNGFEPPTTQPTWAEVFVQISPFAALRNAVGPVFEGLAASFLFVGGEVPADPPVFMEAWFAVLVLAAWIVLPVLGGYLSFARTDL